MRFGPGPKWDLALGPNEIRPWAQMRCGPRPKWDWALDLVRNQPFGGSYWFGDLLGMGHIHFGGPMVLDVRFLTLEAHFHPHLPSWVGRILHTWLLFSCFLDHCIFCILHCFIFCTLFLIVCVFVQFSYCTFPVITSLSSRSLAPACVISAEWGWVSLRRFCSETV